MRNSGIRDFHSVPSPPLIVAGASAARWTERSSRLGALVACTDRMGLGQRNSLLAATSVWRSAAGAGNVGLYIGRLTPAW